MRRAHHQAQCNIGRLRAALDTPALAGFVTAHAEARLEMLRRRGPSADAFIFRSPFPPPGSSEGSDTAPDDGFCPA